MCRVRRIVVVCVGVLALSVLASASALAATAGWMVNGTNLKGSAALATTAAVVEEGVLVGVGFHITCEGHAFFGSGPEIKSPNTGAASSLEFSECKGEEPCKINSPILKTYAVTEEATLEGVLAAVATFKPATGTIFATIKFEGSECPLEGETPIKGTAKALAPFGQDEGTLGQVSSIATEASKELLVGSSAVSAKGASLLRLTSGQSWSFL
jgi:hypothetical protein